jgi:hypothetical protein
MSWIRSTIYFVILSFILFELSSFVATKMNLFLVNSTPSIYKKFQNMENIFQGMTERDEWGAWHAKNSTYWHSSSCFDVIMSFNEVGARDKSFLNLPDDSIILLGDSFAEGYGVSENKTSQYLIEAGLSTPILNFGTSGNFGPLQELLLYKHFLKIPHQGLIIYVLPHNDFTDNDTTIWSKIDKKRYRPYFSKQGDPLIPYYFPTAIPQDKFFNHQLGYFKHFIIDHFWTANALRTSLMLMRGKSIIKYNGNDNKLVQSYFFDANQTQQDNLIMAYEEILNLAKDKDVLFVIIPSQNDIIRWKKENKNNAYKKQSWYKNFISFQERPHQRVSILNLMDYLPLHTEKLFFSCDSHWSPFGNAWASKIILHHLHSHGLFQVPSKK